MSIASLPIVPHLSAGQAVQPTLPPLYDGWMRELLGFRVEDEPLSTCGDCAMARPSAEVETAHAARFRADAKCCTYLPTVWNFLAGGVLADDSPGAEPGRASVERRIDRAVAVSPLGLRMSSTYEVLYRSRMDTFGRNAAFRCPHFLEEGGGSCGVWRHRNAVCSTYFCKLRRGAAGGDRWGLLRQLLATVEEELARWCLLELEIEPAVLRVLFPAPSGSAAGRGDGARHDQDGGPDPEQRLRLWGRRWVGREREFYRACAQLVQPLPWDDVLRVCGPAAAVSARLVQESFASLSAPVPDRLRMGRLSLLVPEAGQEQTGVCYVSTYSPTDVLKLPDSLLVFLPLFDGQRTTAQVLDEITGRGGAAPDPELIRRLVDFQVLVPSDGEPPPG